MDSDWKLLVQMGLPLGPIFTLLDAHAVKADAILAAVGRLSSEPLDPTETDALSAWLSAFNHHWPSAFSQVLGEVGASSLRTLLPKVEPNRYLKLRRIAIANLANLL